MGFLDNSGDIILDAVLTDTGRHRMAQGNFKIVKFAFGDDEIDYTTYNKNHPSGSAFFDLETLQAPILEAFTNNTSLLKSKLITIPRTNLLYLPRLKVNNLHTNTKQYNSLNYVVTADKSTEDSIAQAPQGVIFGSGDRGEAENKIRVDQGLDTAGEIAPESGIPPDLKETQYIIEIDNRLGRIVSTNGVAANVSFIDDDNIASYFLGSSDVDFVTDILDNRSEATNQTEIINGPRGTKLEFKIRSSIDLKAGTFLFTQIGASGTTTITTVAGGTVTVSYIDTIVKVSGVTTGYRIDLPVRFVRE